MNMHSKEKLEHLHNLVSFVSRKRVFIEENLHNLSGFYMYIGAKKDCANAWLDEDLFEGAVADNYEFPEQELTDTLATFFVHNENLNHWIDAFKETSDKQHQTFFDLDDGIELKLLEEE